MATHNLSLDGFVMSLSRKVIHGANGFVFTNNFSRSVAMWIVMRSGAVMACLTWQGKVTDMSVKQALFIVDLLGLEKELFLNSTFCERSLLVDYL